MVDLSGLEHRLWSESGTSPAASVASANPVEHAAGGGGHGDAGHDWTGAEALADLSHRLSGGVDLSTIVRAVGAAARTLLSADYGALALLDGDQVSVVVGGADQQSRFRELTVGVETAVCGIVLRTGRPYRAVDYVASPEIWSAAPQDGRSTIEVPRSILAVPVRHGEIIGVLEVLSTDQRAFTDEEEALLERVAATAADAIVNARVLASERETRAEVEALLAATASLGVQAEPEATLRTLVEQAAKLLEAERATFAVFHDGRVVIPCVWLNGEWLEDERDVPQGGIAKLVWDTGRPYRANNLGLDPHANLEVAKQHQFRSQLTVPLLAADSERLGLVSVNNSRRDTGFTERDELLLIAFCEYGSSILRRANDVAARRAAEQEADRRRREVEALLEAADRINSATDPEDVWQQVVSSAARLVGVQRAVLLTREDKHLLRRYAWEAGSMGRAAFELPLDGTISGRVFSTQTPYISNELPDDSLFYAPVWEQSRRQTILSLPIIGREGNSLGVLNLQDHVDGTPFTDRDLHLAEGLAHHAAVAVERALLTSRLRASEERFRSLVQNTSDIIALIDAQTDLIYVSPSVMNVLGFQPEELLGSAVRELIHPDDLPKLQEFIVGRPQLPQNRAIVEFRARDRGGTWHHLEALVTNRLDEPSVAGIVLNIRDVSDRVRLEDRLRYEAYHDALTDLPNRSLYLERLEHALETVSRATETVGVLFLDLDRFKVINDSLGHRAGDELLMTIGRRLSESIRPDDIVARFGGDEFAVLLDRVGDGQEAQLIAEHLLRCLSRNVTIRGQELVIAASIGVAVSGLQPVSADELLRQADLALYRAKAMGAAQARLFDPAMDNEAVDRLELETDLRRALERDELRLDYQPEVNLQTGRVVGLEALLRWRHPKRGVIPPLGFIPMAEETGLIVPIGEWVLEEACRQYMRLRRQIPSHAPLTISVNLSERQLEQPDLIDKITQVLERTGMEAACLKLEITESIMMRDVDSNLQTLRELKTLGVQVAIDDFGTGYSSLSYLQRFALDTLKIDQSFMHGLGEDSSTSAIVEAIIVLAHAIGMDVTAEGVETAEQVDFLRRANCDFAQGFHLYRPIPGDDLAALLID